MGSRLFYVPKTGAGAGRLNWTRGGGMSPGYFQDLENLIKQFQRGSKQWGQAQNLLVRSLAMMTVSNAIEKSYGMRYDYRNPERGAWMTPVRRITEGYLHGWKVKKRGPSRWLVYNDSRQAYFIEYGIHTSPLRVKRPIMKNAMKRTIRFTRGTDTFKRFAEGMLGPGRGPGGRFISANDNFVGGPLSNMLHRMPHGGFRVYGL